MADITWAVTNGQFEDGNTQFSKVCQLDTNKFVVVFMDDDDTDKGKARVGTVDGSTITWGDAVEFVGVVSRVGSSLAVCKLDTDKFIVAYGDVGQSNQGYVRLGNVSTRTISFEAAVGFSGLNDAEVPSLCALSTSKFAIVYNDETGGDVGTICICTVDGSDLITPDTGNALQFEGSLGTQTTCIKLDTDKVLAFYIDAGDVNHTKACAFSIANTTPTAGAILVVDADSTCSSVSVSLLALDKATLHWGQSTNRLGRAVIVTRDNNPATDTLHAGSIVEVNSYSADCAVLAVDATQIVFVYRDRDNLSYGTSRLATFSGTTITLNGEEVWNAGVSVSNDLALVDTNKMVNVYVGSPGEAIIGDMPVAGWTGGDVLGVDIATIAKINGVALADITKVNGIA